LGGIQELKGEKGGSWQEAYEKILGGKREREVWMREKRNGGKREKEEMKWVSV